MLSQDDALTMTPEEVERLGKTYESAKGQVRVNCPHCDSERSMYYRKKTDDWVCGSCRLNIFINIISWGQKRT